MIGKEIVCDIMPDGSNYKVVTGKVVDIRNGYAVILISGYQTIFNENWCEGNGLLKTSALVENCAISGMI